MRTSTEIDVLIVGGGPTGLVLAVELARRDVRFRIVDRNAEYFGGSRADGLQPRTLEVFGDLGILPEILAEGDNGILVRGYQGDKMVWEGRPTEPTDPTPDVPYPNIWFVPQYRTEQILRDRIAKLGATVELATELVKFSQDADGVTATLARDGAIEQVCARYLVGADGGRSTVRKQLGIEFIGQTDEATTTLIADARVDGLDRSHGRIWMTEGTGVALMPLAGSDLFTVTARTPPEDSDEPVRNYLQQAVTEASGREDIRLREVTWCTVWRSNTRLAQRFRDGRVFLAGDAAHVCPPTGGQGMNTGIQDSHNLGWKLAAVLSGAPATVLDSYQIERRRTAEAALAVSAALLAKHQRGDDDAYRRDGAVHQLGLNYRGGPLSEEDSSAPGPLVAGDRAPDAPCRYPDGTPISLFELFRGPHWTLLGFGADRSATVSELAAHCDGRVHGHTIVQLDEPATTGTIVDAHGHARRGYGVASSTLALVRPDGYLGLIGGPDPTERVTRYLARVGALRRDVDRSRTPEDLPHSTD